MRKEEEIAAANSPISGISMRKDLTPAERKEETALYNELQAKRAQASGDDKPRWVRRNKQVVFLKEPPGQAAGGSWE